MEDLLIKKLEKMKIIAPSNILDTENLTKKDIKNIIIALEMWNAFDEVLTKHL